MGTKLQVGATSLEGRGLFEWCQRLHPFLRRWKCKTSADFADMNALQVEGLLGMCADDLALLKEGDAEKQQQYFALLKRVQWQDFVVRVQTRTRSATTRALYALQTLRCPSVHECIQWL